MLFWNLHHLYNFLIKLVPRLYLWRTILLFSPDLKFPTITMTTNDTGVYSQFGCDGLLCSMLESATTYKDYPLHHRHYCSKNIYFGMRANKIIYQEVSFTKHFLLPKILPNLFTAHCEKFVSFKTLSLTSEWMFTVSFTFSACNEGYPKVPEDFTIMKKAPTSAFTLKTLLRHYTKRALTP